MFVKLFSSILDSSVWAESLETRIVWVTILALADRDGFVRASPSGLARRANVTVAACRTALQVLEGPDVESSSQEWAGRRVEAIEGGWQVLNYTKYRDLRDPDVRREQVRTAVRKYRNKVKSPVIGGNPPQAQADTEVDTEADTTLHPGAGDVESFVRKSLHRPEYRDALGGLLRAAQHPERLAATIRGFGPGGIHECATWEVLGHALMDLAASPGTATPAALKGFIRHLQAGDPPPRPRGRVSTQAENEAALAAWAAKGASDGQ